MLVCALCNKLRSLKTIHFSSKSKTDSFHRKTTVFPKMAFTRRVKRTIPIGVSFRRWGGKWVWEYQLLKFWRGRDRVSFRVWRGVFQKFEMERNWASASLKEPPTLRPMPYNTRLPGALPTPPQFTMSLTNSPHFTMSLTNSPQFTMNLTNSLTVYNEPDQLLSLSQFTRGLDCEAVYRRSLGIH